MLPHLSHKRVFEAPWRQALRSATSGGTWLGRDGAHLVQLDSGRVLLIGGWKNEAVPSWDGLTTTNEIFATDDLGEAYSMLLAHDSAPPTSGPGARFKRFHAGAVVPRHVVGGIPYAYVMGNDPILGANGEVWRTPLSGDGTLWEMMTDTAPCSAFTLHMAASFNGSLLILGGQDSIADPNTARKTVYRSSTGAAWTQLADAPWSGRGSVYAPAVHGEKLIIAGGAKYSDTPGARVFFNDVWSLDTADAWAQVLANGHTQWKPRHYHGQWSLNGRLWLFCGHAGAPQPGSGQGDLSSIVYSDNDGSVWHPFEDAAWRPSHADAMCVASGRILRAGGNAESTFDTATYEIIR